jgi:hypothetical protein
MRGCQELSCLINGIKERRWERKRSQRLTPAKGIIEKNIPVTPEGRTARQEKRGEGETGKHECTRVAER